MAIEYICDLCGAKAPIPTALKDITIGDDVVAQVCISCGSKIKTEITEHKTAALAPKVEPEAPKEEPKAEEKPAEAPAEAAK